MTGRTETVAKQFETVWNSSELLCVLAQRSAQLSPDKREEVDRDPRRVRDERNAPWPVRRGGAVLKLYENSLSLAVLVLFLVSFLLHAISGRLEYNEEQALHGSPAVSLAGYMSSSRFWFESFQNGQSKFLAIGCMVVFSIYLRQKGSPESKPVDAPHSQTGG